MHGVPIVRVLKEEGFKSGVHYVIIAERTGVTVFMIFLDVEDLNHYQI